MALIRPNNKALSNITTLPSGITEYNLQETDLPNGTVLQVQSYTFEPSGSYDNNLTSDSYVDSGFGVLSITPIKSGSKIFVEMSGWAMHTNPDNNNKGGNFRIYRSIAGGAYAPVSTNSQDFIYKTSGSNWEDQSGNARYMDTPSYTLGQQISYKLYGRKSPNGTATRFYHGGGHKESDYNVIIFTAMEIAG
jgi:hypothetical protein